MSRTTKTACAPTEHNFTRLSDTKAICSKCGEFRTQGNYYFDWTYYSNQHPRWWLGLPVTSGIDNVTISTADTAATTVG